MNTNKILSALVMVSALAFASVANAADKAPTRGQVSVSGSAVKAVVAGPVAIHACSGFSGGTIYAARACLATNTERAFEMLWHASKDAPAPMMLARRQVD